MALMKLPCPKAYLQDIKYKYKNLEIEFKSEEQLKILFLQLGGAALNKHLSWCPVYDLKIEMFTLYKDETYCTVQYALCCNAARTETVLLNI